MKQDHFEEGIVTLILCDLNKGISNRWVIMQVGHLISFYHKRGISKDYARHSSHQIVVNIETQIQFIIFLLSWTPVQTKVGETAYRCPSTALRYTIKKPSDSLMIYEILFHHKQIVYYIVI
jgi:hypothetical protein